MDTAIIIHGSCDKEEYFSDSFPSLSNSHWIPWLQKQLIMNGIHTDTPEMPLAYQPDYSVWCQEMSQFLIDQDTLLIGHSCGGGFLVRYLSEHPIKIKKLVLVAAWLDPDRSETADFFNFTIDSGLTQRMPIDLLISDDDEQDILQSARILEHELPEIRIHRFANKGHFTTTEMGDNVFTELLALLLPHS